MYPINPFAYPQTQLGAGFQAFANPSSLHWALSQSPQVNPMTSSQPIIQPTSSASTSSSTVEANPVVSSQPSTQPTNAAISVPLLSSFLANSYPYPYTSPLMASTNTAPSYPMLPGNPLVNVQQLSLPATSAASTSYTSNYYTLIEKQKVFHHLIESLKSNDNCDAIEAEIKYNYLYSLYESYASTEAEISSYLRGTNFTNRMKKAEQFQREVIALQVSLKNIMKNAPSLPVAKPADDQTKPKNVTLIKIEKINSPKSDSKPTATETAKTDAEVPLATLKLDDIITNCLMSGFSADHKELVKNALNQAGKFFDPDKWSVEIDVREESQANKSADKTEVSTPEEFEILSKPNETDDQANQTKQPENRSGDAQTGGIKKSDSTNVASSSPASNANLSTEQTKPKNVTLIKTEKIDCPKSDPKPTENAKTDTEVPITKLKLDDIITNCLMSGFSADQKELMKNTLNQAGKLFTDSGKWNVKIDVHEPPPQANESANKTDVLTPEEFEILMKPDVTDDQANQAKQPESRSGDAVIEQDDIKILLDHFSRLLEKKD